MHRIELEASQRILLLDGAMGTMIQSLPLTENDYRDASLAQHPGQLKGNSDLLNITCPDAIQDIHQQYLQAGADILSTNTFGANRISQEDYQLAHRVYEMNYQGAVLARKAIAEYRKTHPDKALFVAGAMGPTTKLASLSPDINNPGFRSVTFDQLAEAYTEQAIALIDGGVDLFLLETITDTLNAKAALYALMNLFDSLGRQYPIMVSGTITDASGRILSGQTIEAFLVSISHAPLLSVGLNCAFGAKELRPFVEVVHKETSFLTSAHPNAGLPNQFGEYEQSAEEFATLVGEFAANGWLNIVGGCCGTTPEHIAATARIIKDMKPRDKRENGRKSRNAWIDADTQAIMKKWLQEENDKQVALPLTQLMQVVSSVEDEATFRRVKAKFEAQQMFYHPEQAALVNAQLFGRYQYLRIENRLQQK